MLSKERLSGLISQLHKRTMPECIGINGLDCAGKTTLAVSLAQALRDEGRAVQVMHADDFNNKAIQDRVYKAYAADKFSPELFELYYQKSIDYDRLAKAIRHAKAEGETLIVEGVFLFRPPLDELIDYGIFIDVEPDEARQRYALRKEREGDTRPLSVFDHIWLPAFECYCTEYDPRCGAQKIIELGT